MLMSAQSQPPGRVSQFLPTVKCSNCNNSVPLAELGEHVCAPPPPLPTVNTSRNTLNIPKPPLSPGAATSLLPQRLQGLIPPRSPGGLSPGARSPGARSPGARSPGATSPHAPARTQTASRAERPALNTSGPKPNTYPTRSSPLARTGDGPPMVRSASNDPYAPRLGSPVHSRPPVGRARSGSLASPVSPATARPSFASDREIPRSSPAPVDERSVDTQTGGTAGMAGVGRRGFAAAARAAVFATPSAPAPPSARTLPPRKLDIGAVNVGPKTSTPPPLSTSPGSSNSPGIAPSPVSPESLARSPPRVVKMQLDSSASRRPSGSMSQSSGSEYGLAYANSDYDDDDDDDADLRRVNAGLGSYKAKGPPPPLPLSAIKLSLPSSPRKSFSREREPSANGRSEGSGPIKHSKSKASLSSDSEKSDYGDSDLKRNNSSRIAQALGLSQTPPSAYGRRGGPGKPSLRNGHSRTSSSRSGQSDYSTRSAVPSGQATATPSGDASHSSKGQLERQMDRMADGAERPGLSNSNSSGKIKDLKVAKHDDSTGDRVVRKIKVCIRCEKKIDDGKWVQVDGGGVLCEKCWKNMYLPKCRRCNLPIEKQAVSSSDGQLKGKYHRECFNCHVCHKPFPDKTFYVLDSKPLCAYHYHEANDSLCAATRCGQPIEGPCAVSHAGDRYHPEHMLCEYPGYGGCKERLEEYWEVDGRMLCERHSRASRLEEEEANDRGRAPTTRAMKRTTRYIDLAKR